MEDNRPTQEDLQEKALYDLVQYLPLDSIDIEKGDSLNIIIKNIEDKKGSLPLSSQQAIEDNLPVIKAILKDRPELGKAKIANMSWQDNNNDGKPDHPVLGMQACTFEREDQVYISFRGTPKRAWLDNGKAFTPDNVEAEERYDKEVYNQLHKWVGSIEARYYLQYRENEKLKRNDAIEKRGMLNGIFPPEIYKYTSPMQEEAILYMEELKNPADGSASIFDKYDNVYVTGHSKGGNEATLVTIIYSDLIDRCISGNGQGFSPEFVKFVKKNMGEEGFGKIQDKMYGFHGDNDFVNPTGVIVIKEENRIYFVPEMEIESLYDLVYNHFPQGMINPETGKIAQITEQGPLGKYVGLASEKLMQRNIKDRGDAAILVMALMQDLFANAPPIYSTEEELGIDKLDIKESRWNGLKVLGEVLGEALMEEEGEALINWMAKEFGDEFPLIKKFSKAYDSLEIGDGIKDLYQQYLAEILNDLEKEKEQEREQKYENYNALMLKQMELEAAVTMGGEYAKRYDKFGTLSDLGVVAINYENTKELIRIIDAMDNLVTGKIIPEMDDIAEDLRRMRYWKVDVRRWTDIRDAIEESNNRRKKLRERLMHYYNACESMESRFVERMGIELCRADVMI